jgi:hypothetical protein
MTPVLFGLRIHEAMEPEVLQKALTSVGRRHEALRQFFPSGESPTSGACLMVDEYQLPLLVIDQTADMPAAERVLAEYLNAPFDLGRPPLVRAALVPRRSECLLAVSVDHIIFDAGSIAPFLRELSATYAGLRTGGSVAAEGRGDGSPGFGAEESRWLDGDEAEWAREHWEPRWRRSVPTLTNPLATAAGNGSPARAYTEHRLVMPAADITSARSRYRAVAPTLFCLTAAAVIHALHEVAGTRSPNVFFHASRRYGPGTASVIGYLVNSVLISVELPESATFADTARAATREVVSSLNHSMMPFQLLRRWFAPEQALDLASMPAIVLNVLTEAAPMKFAGMSSEYFLPGSTHTNAARSHHHAGFFIIDVLEKLDGCVELVFRFREPPCDSSTVRRFSAVIQEVLSGKMRETV